jgi:hypothetical protein
LSKNRFLLPKFLLFTAFVGIPLCLFIYLVSFTVARGYQHDTDPEGFTAYIVESLGVVKVSHFIPLPTDVTSPSTGESITVKARISHYWPPLGGTNCYLFVNGQCISRMASGEPWQKWVDNAVAPLNTHSEPDLPFLVKPGSVWIVAVQFKFSGSGSWENSPRQSGWIC